MNIQTRSATSIFPIYHIALCDLIK